MSSISDKIVRLRKSKGYGQKEFASMIGVSHVSLSKFENVRTDIITIGVAQKIAHELDISFTKLFEIEDSGAENEKLKIKINDLNEIIKGNDVVISQLLNRVVDKELIIDLLQKEKVTYKKDILHFLEESYDTQSSELKKISWLTEFQKNDIENSVINLTYSRLAYRFADNGLISKSDLDKILPKYKGIVKSADPEEKE